MVIKKRVISLCVTVTGPPFLICCLNNGITDPFEPNTFPKRVVINFVFPFSCKQEICISAIRLVAPITFVGFTALSVDTITNFSAWYLMASSAIFLVPEIFTRTASYGFASIKGTCL